MTAFDSKLSSAPKLPVPNRLTLLHAVRPRGNPPGPLFDTQTMISDQQVREFLDDYIASFADLRGVNMAGLYSLPSVMTRADGSVYGFTSSEEARTTLARVTQAYWEQGARFWRFDSLATVPIGSRSVLATVEWHMLSADGSVLKRWRHSYNLIDTPLGLRILAATYNHQLV